MTMAGALLCLIVIIAFFLFKGVHLSDRMQFENSSRTPFTTELKNLTTLFFTEKSSLLKGETDGRINILLLGRAGEHYPGKNLTDTIMIMSINTETKQVALLSLPRDLYVPITKTGLYTKLNAVYQYGLSSNEGIAPLRESLEAITGEPIHYFATLDFDGFEKGVNTVGGISLDVVRDFSDTHYPGKNYSYETFTLKKGWQTLDGATALKYVRERHDDPEGDFGRAKRQQQVIQALKNKVFSLDTLFNVVTVSHLLDTLGESIKTDMSLEDMARFLELTRTLDTKNITTVVVDAWKKESLLRVSHLQVGNIAAFILVPRVGNFSEIENTSKHIFEHDSREQSKQAVLNESPTLTLFSAASDRGAAEEIAAFAKEEMGFMQVNIFPTPPLNKRPEKSIMVERANLAKPFSVNELLKRFSLFQATSLPFTPPHGADSDVSIVIGEDLGDAFSLTEVAPGNSGEDETTFSEPLPPQPKKKK